LQRATYTMQRTAQHAPGRWSAAALGAAAVPAVVYTSTPRSNAAVLALMVIVVSPPPFPSQPPRCMPLRRLPVLPRARLSQWSSGSGTRVCCGWQWHGALGACLPSAHRLSLRGHWPPQPPIIGFVHPARCFARRMLHVACRMLHVAYCMSHVACCMLVVACNMLHVASAGADHRVDAHAAAQFTDSLRTSNRLRIPEPIATPWDTYSRGPPRYTALSMGRARPCSCVWRRCMSSLACRAVVCWCAHGCAGGTQRHRCDDLGCPAAAHRRTPPCPTHVLAAYLCLHRNSQAHTSFMHTRTHARTCARLPLPASVHSWR
jgi:hypothetical protein